MMSRWWLGGWVLLTPLFACGAEVRYFECNGVTYREIRPDPPTARAPCVPQPARPQSMGPTQRGTRTCWMPVTQYVYEGHWVNWWNPFAQPQVAYACVPRTRWELRTQAVDVPLQGGGRAAPIAASVAAPGTVDPRMASRPTEPPRQPLGVSGAPAPAPDSSSSGSQGTTFGGLLRADDGPPRWAFPPAGP